MNGPAAVVPEYGYGYGGYAEVARRLTDAGPRAVTRQGVYTWWKRRNRNGFPDYHYLDGDGAKQFSISEVLAWYMRYVPPPESHWGRGGGGKRK